VSGASARFYQRNTVSVSRSGTAWPFVALKQPGALFFQYDPQAHQLAWCSGNCEQVLGTPEQAVIAHGALFLAHLHPSDRFKISTLLENALASGVPYVATYRWIRPDTGELTLLHCRAMMDGDGSALRGFITDLTAESALLRSGGDALDTVTDALGCFDSDTLILDTELRIRFARSAGAGGDIFGLGLDGFDANRLQPGSLYIECFETTTARNKAEQLLRPSLEGTAATLSHEWNGYRALFRPIHSNGVVEGILIELRNNTSEQKLLERIDELEELVERLSQAPILSSRAADLSQELVGYAAIVSRSATRDPILRHVAEALMDATRELGSITRGTTSHEPPSAHLDFPGAYQDNYVDGRQPAFSNVVFASSDERTATVTTSLLRGSGLNASACALTEVALRETLMRHNRVRLLILDVTSSSSATPSLLRSLRRFFPALHIVCLVSGSTQQFSELQRAGAALLVSKPVSPRNLERIARNFISFASTLEGELSDSSSPTQTATSNPPSNRAARRLS